MVWQVENSSLKAVSGEASQRLEGEAAARAALQQDLLHSQAVIINHSFPFLGRILKGDSLTRWNRLFLI